MGNKSAEHPDGQLTKSILKSFYAIKGPSENGTFTATHGYERIPDNWYKRSPSVSPYTIPFFMLDVVQEASVYPKFLDIGGNTGTINSFTGVNITDLTAGLYNAKTFTPQNAMCLAFESTLQEAPDVLEGVFTNLTTPLAMLNKAVSSAEAAMGGGCPKLTKIDNSQFNIYPGYKKSGTAA